MIGLLNVHKPAGITSRNVVNHIARLAPKVKAGHAGTLDPLATGVLIVCLGQATRLIEYVQRMSKRYRGEFLLGRQSDTEDIEGEVIELPDAPHPTRGQIEAALPQFMGEILQRPPAYSALKIEGQRAYRLARRGQEVELAPRKVRVDRIEILEYDDPRLVLDIACGSGTYVRSLGRDVAQAVGTAAVMSALERTAIGPFRVEEACMLDELTSESLVDHLLPAVLAVGDLPKLTVKADDRRRIARGMAIHVDQPFETDEIAAIDDTGALVAILTPRSDGLFGPNRNFIAEA
jgi:tRNA pseudouridine55 synthase